MHVGGLAAPELPTMAQVKETFPVKPELGATETVAAADAPAVKVTGDPVRTKEGLVDPPRPMT